MKTELVIKALDIAKDNGFIALNAIFHSDRGSQYTSKKLEEWAIVNNVRLSVGKTGVCWDNAVAESFFQYLRMKCFI
ncbi:MAG: hypothetical protein LBI63_00090 [Candidatus Ancillula sp.]|jgi:transposase InsO family protein|nr:hypothetical protein [Candidatus Ancillula sp.]